MFFLKSIKSSVRFAISYRSKQRLELRWRNYGILSYVNKLPSDPLRSITLGNLLEESSIKYKDRPLVISRHQKKALTFEELLHEADRLAAALTAIGLRRGDRIGLCLPNRYEWLIVMFACTRADLILVALNPAYQAPELEYCINKVGMSTIVCGDIFKTQNYYDMLSLICPEMSTSQPGKIKSNNVPTLKHAIFMSENSFKGGYNYEEVLQFSNQNLVNNIKNSQHLIDPENPTVIQFSSGTTGKPKASISTHFNMVNNSYQIAKRMELDQKHYVACLPNPLFHAYGLTINTGAAIHFGTTFVLPDQAYNPNKTLDAIIEEKCNLIHGTPTMHVDLINVQLKRKENLNIDMAVTGGSPCSPQIFKNMKEILNVKKVKSVYGLSETTAVVFHSAPNDNECQSTTTVGLLSDHMEAKVIDVDGRMVPFGQPGELCLRGYANMLGYWNDEAKTKEMIGPDHWLKTGDQFILEEDGYGKVVGRLKDMIIRGGENIFPKEIEDFLNTHPDILDTQVVGASHERLGEEVCAFVRLKSGKTFDMEKLVGFCKGKIAHFKIPSRLMVVDDFPRTTSGKIQKFKLKELIKD